MADDVTPLTPQGLKSIKLEKTFRGYAPEVVDKLLSELATSVEGMIAERTGLKQRIQELEKELAEHREAQDLMRDALVSAQRAVDELKERTQKECDDMVAKARAEVGEIEKDTALEKEQLETSVRRLRAQEQELRASYRVLLAAALDRLEGNGEGDNELGNKASSLLEALAPRNVGQSEGSNDS